jgi:hypothetical protein
MLKGAFWSGFCYKGKTPTLLVTSRRSWSFVLHCGKHPGKETILQHDKAQPHRRTAGKYSTNRPTIQIYSHRKKRYSYSFTGLDRLLGLQKAEASRILNSRHIKVVRLSALRTSRLYSQEVPWYSFLLQGASAEWSRKN